MQDNQDRSRFECEIEGAIVFANYRTVGGIVLLTHVEAPPHLRGMGAAARLMGEIADHARAAGILLRPQCSYAAAWFKRHPDCADVLG